MKALGVSSLEFKFCKNIFAEVMFTARSDQEHWQLAPAAGAGWMKLLGTSVSVDLPDQIGKGFLNHRYLQDTNGQRRLTYHA